MNITKTELLTRTVELAAALPELVTGDQVLMYANRIINQPNATMLDAMAAGFLYNTTLGVGRRDKENAS